MRFPETSASWALPLPESPEGYLSRFPVWHSRPPEILPGGEGRSNLAQLHMPASTPVGVWPC
jgi:hypothetical protein